VQVQAPTASLSPEWLQAQWSRFRRDRFIVRGDMENQDAEQREAGIGRHRGVGSAPESHVSMLRFQDGRRRVSRSPRRTTSSV
jgi:hypothetical protein